MATTTVPTTMTPGAMALAKELGLERELEAILEQGRRTVKGLRSYQVSADTESSMGPVIIVEAKVDPDADGDPSHLAWWSWRIDQFGPDVASDFIVIVEADEAADAR